MSAKTAFTSTKGLTQAELEVFAHDILASNKLVNLMPGIIMMWFEMLLLGFMVYLFIEWKCVAEKTERKGHKFVVVRSI
jgi:hypothetical protein